MLTLKDRNFFESRREMTNFLIQRLAKSRPFDLADGILQYAKRNADPVLIRDQVDKWEEYAPSLYHADVVLRQYDRPWSRLSALILMGGGIVLLLIPTVDGFVHAVLGQLPR
jgi:hypothetical protein